MYTRLIKVSTEMLWIYFFVRRQFLNAKTNITDILYGTQTSLLFKNCKHHNTFIILWHLTSQITIWEFSAEQWVFGENTLRDPVLGAGVHSAIG